MLADVVRVVVYVSAYVIVVFIAVVYVVVYAVTIDRLEIKNRFYPQHNQTIYKTFII